MMKKLNILSRQENSISVPISSTYLLDLHLQTNVRPRIQNTTGQFHSLDSKNWSSGSTEKGYGSQMIDYQFRRARSSAKETDENESERKQKTWRKQEKDGRRRREFGDSRMRTMHFILEGYSRGGGGGRSCGKEGKTPRHGILISPLFPQYPGRNEERSAAFYPPP